MKRTDAVPIDPLPAGDSITGAQRLRRLAIVGLKALVSIGLIAFLATRLDFSRLASHWQALNLAWVAGALAILLVETSVLAGVRLNLMLAAVGARRPLKTTARIALCGLFFEQVTIGFVGGDAVRLWLLRKANVEFAPAVQALLFDRAIGFASILVLSLLGIHALLPMVDDAFRSAAWVTLAVFGVLGAAGVAGAFALTRLRSTSNFAASWQRLVMPGQISRNIAVLAAVFALALATHLLNVLVFWTLSKSLGLGIAPYQWFVVAPTVLLISMVPISAGGWGLREGAMVMALHGFGVPAGDAILPSILFGLCVACATLPGGILWIIDRRSAGKPSRR